MLKNLARRVIRTVVYHALVKPSRTRTMQTRAAGFTLTVPPTVFHPRWFLSSEILARFIGTLDLGGTRAADIGTGSGILALACARAGAQFVTAIDINPAAALAASENSNANSVGDRVAPVCSDLFAAIANGAKFDVIVSNPPFFKGEPDGVAGRAWYAGANLSHIAPMFEGICDHLAPDGSAYIILSSDADLATFTGLMEKAGLEHQVVLEHRLFFESMLIYRLRPATHA